MPLSRSSDQSRAVAVWLFAVAVLVFAMVVVGGATRLTDSGLSITEWKPVTGALPPLTHQAWLDEFQKYQRIPQYQQLNRGMTLAAFQGIFWWEWAHRLLGRVIGLAFLLPFLAFLGNKRLQRARFLSVLSERRLPQRLVWRCWLLLALGGLQGLVGWWMVASGLSGRVDVAPERLTLHLGLALIVFCLLIWTGLESWFGPGRPNVERRWRYATAGLAALVFLQIMLGGLVAGNDAGRIFNDWPLMNGHVLPQDYLSGQGLLRGLLHSQAAVQFNHRIGAYLLFVAALTAAVLALRSRRLPKNARRLVLAFAALVTLQASLGIATLMAAAPLGLALAHQCLAAVVLAGGLAMAWRARRA